MAKHCGPDRERLSIHSVFNTEFGACTMVLSPVRVKTVKSKEISLTKKLSPLISTRSPTSSGCLTKRKTQDARISCAVTEKTKDMARMVEPRVASTALALGASIPIKMTIMMMRMTKRRTLCSFLIAESTSLSEL